MPRVARALLTSVSILGLAVPIIRAQQESQGQRQVAQPQPQDPTVAQKLDKAQKKKIKKSLKELDTPYKQWLNEDVIYIISPEERNAFGQLATNEEREQFIEQFWLRREQQPGLARERIQGRALPPHRVRQRALRFGYPGMEDGSRPHLHHVGTAGRDWNRIRRAAPMTGRWKKAAVRRRPIRGKRGAIAISKAWAITSIMEFVDPTGRANIT